MAKRTAIIRAGALIVETPNSDKRLEIAAESDAWFAWLQSARTFAFDDPSGHFTARKKRRWEAEYWYAIQRRGGRLYETYLGKAVDLTLERLRAGAAKLNEVAARTAPPHAAPAFPTTARARPEVVRGAAHSITSSSAAKLSAPRIRLPHLVRTHALDRLNEVTAYPLTLVSAPAGYGKTTLLAQWLVISRLPAAWLTLDERDNDPSRFWSHVCTVLAQLIPDLAVAARRLTRIPASQRDTVILTTLITALQSAPAPTLLVLDDYHEIRVENSAIHAGVAHLLERLPPHVHVALASRTIPPFPLAKLRSDHQLLELRTEDLQFTLAETSDFLSERMRIHLTDEQIAMLHARTEGWIAGLQLAALSLQEQPDVARWIEGFNGENRYIFDYLVEEVLNSLPAELQAFVLQMSLLERINASLCDAVMRTNNSQAILDDLERANLFLVPLDDRREWYRFHQLFADVLRRYLRMTQPTVAPRLYTRASHWCEAHGFTLEAIDYAFAANELKRAADLIEAYIPVALALDYRMLLLEKLNRLPDSLVRQRPRLSMAHAYTLFTTGVNRTLMRQRVHDAEESLARANQPFEPAELAILRSEALALGTSIRQFLQGELPPRELIALHQQALAALPRRHWLRSFIILYIGVEQLMDGNVRAATHTLDTLMHTSEAHFDLFYVAMSALYLGLALMQQGRLDDALTRGNRVAQRLADHANADLMARAQLIIGKVIYERDDLVGALNCLRQGISLRYDPAPFLLEAYPTLAHVHLALGHRAAAHQAIEQALAEWAGAQAENRIVWAWTGKHIHAHQARLWLLEGDLEAASAWARTLRHDQETASAMASEPPTYVREWEEIVLARVYLAEQRADDALALLERLGAVADMEGRKSRLLEILTLQAVAHDAAGNTPAAMLALQRAVELGAPQRFVRVFVEGGPTVHRLLMLLRTERMQRDPHRRPRQHAALLRYTESLLAAFEPHDHADQLRRPEQLLAANDSRAVPTPLPKLTQRERQIMRLLADGATNREIAAALVISEATVKRHVSNILMALHARNRTQAVARAREFHLLGVEVGSSVQTDFEP